MTTTAFASDQFHLALPDGDQIVFTSPFITWSGWELYKEDMGRLVHGDDVAIIQEMFEAAEAERNKELDRKIRILGEGLEAMSHCKDTKWYQRKDSWTQILPGTEAEKEWPQHRAWEHFMLWPLNFHEQGDEIEEVLSAAEEDFDYEQWINSPQYVKSVEEYNRHKLLATEKMVSPNWAGECTGDHAISREGCVFYNTFLLDRYTLVAVIRTEFPNQWGNTGYAKASSDYGDIYIPNKFCGYIGEPGSRVIMTVALQDVGGGGRKANGFRWTCIYIH